MSISTTVLLSTPNRKTVGFLHEECMLVYHFKNLFFTITLFLNDNKTRLMFKDH